MDNRKIWSDFINNISSKVSTMTFNTWFKDLHLLTINDNDIVIIVPYPIYKTHIMKNYIEEVKETFLDITGVNKNIIFCLEGEYKEQIKENVNNTQNLLLNNINNDETITKYVEKRKTNLNEKYTFDNFVIGEANRFAYTSSMAVAQNPGKLYNPLFLYGKSGLGKTHLMHAIGNYITNNSDLKVLYISTDDFITEFINCTRDSGSKEENLTYIELFKSKFRDIDVLMIDDIQFLGSANATQQEFTNTFNSLYYNEKQIIICSDRSVDDLKLLEDRLKTRFNWGLKATINPPEYELKVKIIKNKISNGDLVVELPDEIIDFIASNCGNDVRNLEGAIRRLHCYSAMMGLQKITLDNALEALVEYTNNMIYSDNSISKIMQVVASYFNLTTDVLKGKRRTKEIANARMIAMYLCRMLTEETYERIGLEFGGRDHTTVIHGYEEINKEILKNPELEKMVNDIKLKMSE